MLTKPVATPKTPSPVPSTTLDSGTPSKELCSRCRQGFFCSDHGTLIFVLYVYIDSALSMSYFLDPMNVEYFQFVCHSIWLSKS